MQALYSVLPILIALSLGYLSSKYLLPPRLCTRLCGMINPLVWILLFLIGAEFGEAVSSLDAVGYVLKISSLVAIVTTAIPCLMLLGLTFREGKQEVEQTAKGQSRNFLDLRVAIAPLKECFIALLMVALGVLFNMAHAHADSTIGVLPLPSSNSMLMALIFLVGIDLSNIKIGRNWISWSVFIVPVVVIVGSILGAFLIKFFINEDIRLLLALSTGFGWFTLSSVLIGGMSGEVHGATALLTDLGRELIAIVLLYLFGHYQPKVSIAAAGATALDSTLPIVRQTCDFDMLPIAFMSGFILTILAPFFITFFLTF